MSILERSLQTKAAIPIAQPGRYPATSFQLINGRLVAYTDNQINYLTKGYDINDIIYSIVNLIMDKCRVAPWSVYKIVDEQAYKQLHGMTRKGNWSATDYVRAQKLQRKALEVSTNPGKWGELLKYANSQETFNDYAANGIGYNLLIGNWYTWGAPLKMGANQGIPNELWNLPAQYVNIWSTDTFPSKIVKYNVNRWPTIFYQPTEILHVKYWNPHWNVNGEQLYGISPLKAALLRLNNNNSSVAASAASFQNEGIKGVLHMKATPGAVDAELLVQEVDRLKDTMINEWTGEQQRGRMGLGAYDMGWLPIGLNSEEMQMIESQKWDLRMLCNIYGIQSQLLNDPDNKTYANAEEAEKALTTRAALPQLTRFRDGLNRKARADWGLKEGQVIDFDMTAYAELQKDTKEMVAWLTPLMDRGLPMNRALDLLNLEKIDNPYYDEPRVTIAMGQTITEHEMTEVDNALNEDDPEEDIPN